MGLFGVRAALAGSVSRSPSMLAWSRLRRDRSAVLGMAILAAFALAALAAPLIAAAYGDTPGAEHSELISGVDSLPLGVAGGVSWDHWLGVEPGFGRDLLLQLVYGARTSLGIALAATAISTMIGVAIGLAAGYFGGLLDAVLGWFTDVMLAFPFFLFCLAAVPVLNTLIADEYGAVSAEKRVATIIVVFAVFGWMTTARIVRGEVLSLRERDYVAAARVAGAGHLRIVVSELLPNIWPPVIVTASLALPQFVTGEAALSFLNIGVIEPTPDWGRMLYNSVNYLLTAPMLALLPGMALFALVFASNLVGDASRDALDPRSLR